MSRVPTVAALIVAAALVSACSLFDKKDSPTGPTAPDASTPVKYTAFGASDAVGFGSAVVCVPFTQCENGTGYVQIVTRRLRESREVTLSNLGIPAATLSPTIEALAQQYGRLVPANFIDQELPFLSPSSSLVTIFGGANDINALGEAVRKGAGGSNVVSYVDSQVRTFGADVDRLVQGIRTAAPDAFVLILNVPNMAGLPFANAYSLPERQLLQYISIGFSRELNRQAGSGVVVVDLMCDSQVYDPSAYYSDGFHPNDAGYQHLADRIMSVLNGGSSSVPSSCSQMTLVPNP